MFTYQKSTMFVILCFAGLLAQSLAQIALPNGCRPIRPQAQLDANRVLGDWYEWARIDDVYEEGHDCVHIRYFTDANGNIVEEANSTIRISGANYLWRGTIQVPQNAPNGIFNLVFNEFSSHRHLTGGLLRANWDQYIILVACSNVAGMDEKFIWVFTRSPNLAPQYQNEVAEALRQVNIPMDLLTIVNHENCPPY